MPPTPVPLLIASIGNPAPYTNTLHSAGHTLLAALRIHLNFPPFQKDRNMGNGLVSRGHVADADSGATGDWTLWQSTSYMNVSGKGVAEAWRVWLRQRGLGPEGGRLVVLHDELEVPLAKIKVRKGGGSARGHNGLKSILACLRPEEVGGMVRIGIGIGRPVSREADEVARYVLRKMTDGERGAVERAVGEVVKVLEGVERGR